MNRGGRLKPFPLPPFCQNPSRSETPSAGDLVAQPIGSPRVDHLRCSYRGLVVRPQHKLEPKRRERTHAAALRAPSALLPLELVVGVLGASPGGHFAVL